MSDKVDEEVNYSAVGSAMADAMKSVIDNHDNICSEDNFRYISKESIRSYISTLSIKPTDNLFELVCNLSQMIDNGDFDVSFEFNGSMEVEIHHQKLKVVANYSLRDIDKLNDEIKKLKKEVKKLDKIIDILLERERGI